MTGGVIMTTTLVWVENKDALLALVVYNNPRLNSLCAPKFQIANASAASTAAEDEKSFP